VKADLDFTGMIGVIGVMGIIDGGGIGVILISTSYNF